MPRKNLKFKISNLKFKGGFTLIELMVAFSIIAIVGGIGFVSLVSYTRSQTLTQAAANIKQAVDVARFNAVSNVKTQSCNELISYTVKFCTNNCTSELNTKAYQIIENCSSQSNTISTHKLPNNYIFTSSSTCNSVTFSAITSGVDIVSTGGPCNLYIKGLESNQLQVSVSSLGYVSY